MVEVRLVTHHALNEMDSEMEDLINSQGYSLSGPVTTSITLSGDIKYTAMFTREVDE